MSERTFYVLAIAFGLIALGNIIAAVATIVRVFH